MIRPIRIESALIEKTYLSKEIVKIGFSIPEDFSFEAGQFFNILFDPGDKKTYRSYSILNPPSKKGVIESCIKLVDKGYGSDMIRKAFIGDKFTISAPFGIFTFNSNSKDNVFLCTGTGVTPFYSMLLEHVHNMPGHNFTLMYGVATLNELVFNDEFLKLEKKFSNFTYTPTLTREIEEKWFGKRGRVQMHVDDFKNKTFYICGLKEFISETRELLKKNGVESKNILFERYD